MSKSIENMPIENTEPYMTLEEPINLTQSNYIIEITDDSGTIQKLMATNVGVKITPLKQGGMLVNVQ